ncbi:hypothetical protein [Hyphomonas chukchiensis]|nr:hypothetical protein [Hyphomonas chukchiensis]
MRSRFMAVVSALACLAVLSANGLTASAQQKPVDACAEISCPSGMACYEGACFPTSFGDETPDDPCADVSCPADMACYEGGCFLSMDEPSESSDDPCAGVTCPSSMVCYEGGCFESIDAPADASCPQGSVASNGACKPSTKRQTDPCADVLCPAGEACYEGGCFPTTIKEATTPPLVYVGRTQSFTTPPLVYAGRTHQSFTTPPLTYVGTTQPDTPTPAPAGGLEIIALPTGRRTSRYLAIDDATLARDETLRLTYSGLPEKPARIVLFYMGGEAPRFGGRFYLPVKTTSGVYEREGHSLAPFTGPYKACIGFDPDIPANASSPDAYADCVDFTMAGTGSRDAQPALSLSVPEPKAGKRFTVNWSGFPPVNAMINLIDTRTGKSISRVYSSSKPAGEWDVIVREPGTYEFQIYFEGEALRARMPLEVTK